MSPHNHGGNDINYFQLKHNDRSARYLDIKFTTDQYTITDDDGREYNLVPAPAPDIAALRDAAIDAQLRFNTNRTDPAAAAAARDAARAWANAAGDQVK